MDLAIKRADFQKIILWKCKENPENFYYTNDVAIRVYNTDVQKIWYKV